MRLGVSELVKFLFDTSVIVAASLPMHPIHAPCFVYLQAARVRKIQGYVSTHSIAEFYSVMTRMPSQPRIYPREAKSLIENHLEHLEVIPLEKSDYLAAIEQMAALNIPGGGIFDALIAQAALKMKVDKILTLNPNHFTRLHPDVARIIEIPE